MTDQERPDYCNLEMDISAHSEFVVENAQFFFNMSPISVNDAYAPARHAATGNAHTYLTAAAANFKDHVAIIAKQQIRRRDARAEGWQNRERPFSLWVGLRKGHTRCERLDTDNVHKLIQDAFVTAGIIPDDRHARDTRQLYVDFPNHWPKETAFCVLIRWVNEKGPLI